MKKTIRSIIIVVMVLTMTLTMAACDPTGQGKNSDKSFAMVSEWTSSGVLNHFNTNTFCHGYEFFVVEGLYRYVRSTDEVFSQLAAEEDAVQSTHNIDSYLTEIGNEMVSYVKAKGYDEVAVTTVTIRNGAKWHNGDAFVAKDVWAYYYMMHPTSSNYMLAVKVVDDSTVEFVWNPAKEPNDTVKMLLLAQDKSGSVKYGEFASYVDTIHSIVMASPVNENENRWGAFNRWSTDSQITQITVAKNAFTNYNPSWYIATGPFKPVTFTATQILLEKNDYYWNAANIGFEKIKLYSAKDLNQIYTLIKMGNLDYFDGFIQQDTLQDIIDSNENVVNLKMYDPGAIGITFNQAKDEFKDRKVREAFQYIFDREEIKNASNPYAITSNYAALGMAPSEAKTYMSSEAYDNLTQYEKNHQEASRLLTEAGWNKMDGKWHTNGKEVALLLGAPSGHGISATAAEAVEAQLESFGINVELKVTANFYGEAESTTSPYHMSLEWTDLNMSFSYPTGSFMQFNSIYSKWAHLDRYPNSYPSAPQKAGKVKMTFNGLGSDTKTYEFAEYIDTFYSVPEEDLQYLIDVFNTGFSQQLIGVQFFQNVTASTINVGRISGVPMQSYWEEDRNVTYVPEAGSKDFFDAARTNLVYAQSYMIAFGIYQPNLG